MKSAAEYRAYAEQCIESAKTARSPEERDALLEMARVWIEEAHQAEHSSISQEPAKPEPR
jgi:cellobiose-specific phosphotransferase system component IIA